MKNYYYRIKNAIKLGIWCYRNPQTMNVSNFKMLSDLLGLILKVSHEDKAYMTHIAFIHPETGKEEEIVSIWAGSGVAATPTKRIAELNKENSKLKSLLNKTSLPS